MKKQNPGLIAKLLNKNSQPIGQGVHNGHPVEEIILRDVHDLVPNPKNAFYSTDNIEELAAMIDLTQRIEPLIVKPHPDEEGKFMILSGHRRRLAQLYRLEHGTTDDPRVPTIVREVVNPLEGVITLHEMEILNIVFPNKGSRRNLSPTEEAAEILYIKPIIRKIYDQQKASGEVTGKFRTFFASVLGISETTLQRKESIGKLSDAAKEAVEDGRMTVTAAAELSSLSADAQDDALAVIDEEGMRPTVQAIKDQKHPQEQERSIETLLEEVEGQERLPIMEEQDKGYDEDVAEADTHASNLMTSRVYMTTEEAAEIILNLCDELGKKGRDREGVALTKALSALYTVDDLRKAANERHMPLRSFLDYCWNNQPQRQS